MAESEETQDTGRAGFSLTQESITILSVGIALAGLIVVNLGDMRSEARAYRAEARADREAIRAEARADREAFEKQITRLVEQQGTLSGLVDGLRYAIAAPKK